MIADGPDVSFKSLHYGSLQGTLGHPMSSKGTLLVFALRERDNALTFLPMAAMS